LLALLVRQFARRTATGLIRQTRQAALFLQIAFMQACSLASNAIGATFVIACSLRTEKRGV
jgi:hypothetical protein